jgi:NADH dehydrogenase (ubiquinone) Fe-S protein 1
MLGRSAGGRAALQRLGKDGGAAHARCFGALTNKQYAFNARPWELRRVETVDVMDGMGSSITVQTKGGEVIRVNPRENDEINEEWLHDKSRFASVDALKRQRLTRPLVRSSVGGGSQWDETASTWRGALTQIATAFEGLRAKKGGSLNVRAIVGPSVDLYSTLALSDYVAELGDGASLESLGSRGSSLGADVASQFRFNTGIRGLEKADFVLLIGTDIIHDAPLLNLRLRKNFLKAKVDIASVGQPLNLTFPIAQCGLTAASVVDIAEGRHPVCAKLAMAERPAIIVGSQVLEREDGRAIAGAIESIAENCATLRQYGPDGELTWNGVNVVHNSANDCGHLELGRTVPFKGAAEPPADVLYLLGVNEQDLPVPLDSLVGDNTFFIFQSSHGDSLASAADVVLPGAAFTEKSGIYVNFEGRGQKALNAITPPMDAREDWKIIRAVSEVAGPRPLPYTCEADIHARLVSLLPSLEHRNKVSPTSAESDLFGSNFSSKTVRVLSKGVINNTPLRPKVFDYYMEGNVLANNSPLMARCSKEIGPKSNFVEMDFQGL